LSANEIFSFFIAVLLKGVGFLPSKQRPNMKLRGVKLSGFKSFVDLTSVSFPAEMTCIVGPNGCGKSNVIDAVRWVLGESSAKNLRSDSMSDVVFNGSSSRKPVSRASVELFFDNSDGRIGGEFSGYNEISVRRSIEIDGQSNYYLNGTSCRKRDITDLFLGTGLGPKSYAIIEQGMISQLVSAKPEEMRGYIEEVAGISRYLERKRETESSIRKTRDNLSRLEDLREEIGRLLFKLQRQAKAAEKYSQFRKDENYTKGLLLTSRWKDISKKIEMKEANVKEQEIRVEEANASKATFDTKIIALRAKQIEYQTAMDKVQQDFYSFGADISRTEHDLSLKKDRLGELEEKIRTNNYQLESRQQDLKKLTNDKNSIQKSISLIAPELDELRNIQLDEGSITSATKILETEWLLFITESKSLLNQMDKISLSISNKLDSGLTKEDSSSFVSDLKKLKISINKLSSEPVRLTGKTQELLLNSSKNEKRERINLLDKTGEFADLQAKLATIASQDSHFRSGIKELEKDNQSLASEVAKLGEPLVSTQNDLDKLLAGRLKVESELLKARKAIEECSESIHKIEREKIEKEQMAINLREALETLRLERQASKIEAENIVRQLEESDNKLDSLLKEIAEEQTTQILELELESIERKISRLGAINLAAMEEYELEEKRKALLDDQHQELSSALDILQKAIDKIDKETRTSFKDTFDKLNISLAQSFPKLFGGGHAELVLLGDDLLSAGVGITARPPGKKNSSVAQLSGGEKALTAIAIVFAFFELNPAPFCMLDEVDAPLDDLNTMRFIELVEDMSKNVQFVYITHNKISMERSKHLMGVTMQEPGVSRMVAVDVEEAVELAAS
jgi:chromosome segregation ATPase